MNILRVRSVPFAYIALILGIFNFTVFSAILPLRMHEFGIQNENMGYIFMLMSGPYVVMCILYPFLFSKIPPKLQYVIGLVQASIGLMLMSDSSKYLGMPDSEAIIILGMAIIGMGNIFAFIPSMPEIINLMTLRYRIVEGIDDDLTG